VTGPLALLIFSILLLVCYFFFAYEWEHQRLSEKSAFNNEELPLEMTFVIIILLGLVIWCLARLTVDGTFTAIGAALVSIGYLVALAGMHFGIRFLLTRKS
jgi:Ca2+/Na+ antiporter